MTRALQATVLGPVLLAGLAGAWVALAGRGADTAFLYRQRHPLHLAPAAVERAVRTAPEPVAGRKPRGIAARCRPGSARGLRDPWSCLVSYRSGRRSRLRVQVRDDGSYVGYYEAGSSIAEGCCIALPGGD